MTIEKLTKEQGPVTGTVRGNHGVGLGTREWEPVEGG